MVRKHNPASLVALTAVVWSLAVGYLGSRTPPEPQVPTATIFAVGDIMHCASSDGAELTGRLMRRLLNETRNSIGITLGDNSNDNGSEQEYECFDRSSWGTLMPRLYPTPGNHDYGTDKTMPFYFLYFPNAGPPGLGYHAYDVGGWRIYALNSELMGQEQGRHAQLAWLERDLQTHAKRQCTFAYFHRPPFSSGRFASPAWVMPLFRKLYQHGVDLIATGHEHFFAALPPLTPDGIVERTYGVPLLIAGTGGAVLFDRPPTLRYGADGEVVVSRTFGVLKIDLGPSHYEWTFVPADTHGAAPQGSGGCHDNPPGYVG